MSYPVASGLCAPSALAARPWHLDYARSNPRAVLFFGAISTRCQRSFPSYLPMAPETSRSLVFFEGICRRILVPRLDAGPSRARLTTYPVAKDAPPVW